MLFSVQRFFSTLITILLFISVNNNRKEYWGIGCDAQSQHQQPSRFLINLGADIAEIFSHFPTSSLARIFNPIIKMTQNQLSSGQAFGGNGKSLLSNNPNQVRFWVYNDRRNPESFFYVEPRSSSFRTFRVRRNSQVKILIHGFNANNRKRFPQVTKNAYLANTDHTVIAVDWGDLSRPAKNSFPSELLFPAVAHNGFRVADRVADFIIFLLQNGVVSSLDQIHVVGHSLGAHIAGYAGLLVQQRLRARVGRITGLDPAGPLFRSIPETLKLDRSDAHFVDVIHTSVAGLYGQIGHADFYPNGGILQPHCLSKGNIGKIQECNHLSAYDYFAKSIFQRNIGACQCNTWQEYRHFCRYTCQNRSIMGEYSTTRTRGRFFLDLDL